MPSMEHPLSKHGLDPDSLSTDDRRVSQLTPAFFRPGHLLPPAVAVALLIGGWELWTRIGSVPVYIVPGPSVVAARLFGDLGYFGTHGASTLMVALAGFVVGSTVAIGYATLMAHSRLLERTLYPLAILAKVVPIVVWALLFVIWFGFGSFPKVLIAALISFFPVMVNALTGLRSVNPGALDFFNSVHASRREIFFRLRAPSSLPYLFAGFRIAIPLSVIGAFVSEYFTGDQGLGSVISVAHSNLDMPTVFSATLVLAFMGIALTVLTSLLERRLLFWHESFLT